MYEKIYKTGDIAIKSTYTCTNCGTKLILNQNDKIPTCPSCQNTEFTLHENFNTDL